MILLNKSFVYSFIVLSLSYSLVGVVEADVVVSQKSIWILLVCTLYMYIQVSPIATPL